MSLVIISIVTVIVIVIVIVIDIVIVIVIVARGTFATSKTKKGKWAILLLQASVYREGAARCKHLILRLSIFF